MCWYSAIQGPYVIEDLDPPLPNPLPQGGEGTRMNSERASLTPSPPWGRGQGRGGAVAQKFAEHLDLGLSLHDQFQTYTQ